PGSGSWKLAAPKGKRNAITPDCPPAIVRQSLLLLKQTPCASFGRCRFSRKKRSAPLNKLAVASDRWRSVSRWLCSLTLLDTIFVLLPLDSQPPYLTGAVAQKSTSAALRNDAVALQNETLGFEMARYS